MKKSIGKIAVCLVMALSLSLASACSTSNPAPNSSKSEQNSSSEDSKSLSSSENSSQLNSSDKSQNAPSKSDGSGNNSSSSTQPSSSVTPVPPSGDVTDLIANFVKTASDVGTATENPGTANSSTALYADVPDFYVNVTEPNSGDIFASPSGSSSGNGTKEKPYDLSTAIGKIAAGKTLYLLEGTYKLSSTINISKSGTRKSYIKIYAFDNKKVVLDFSSMALNSSNRGVKLSGKYVNIYGIDFKGAGDNGLIISGSYNIIDNCSFYDNRDSGLQIAGSGTSFSAWPHDNLIRNCTSFNNCDATGENADGFACKLTNGNNNTFDGCMSYSNSDDGWDLFSRDQNNGRTIILNSIAFANGKLVDGSGTASGDCNGYKLGYNNFEANNYVENCMAFDNYQTGFTCNGNTGALTLKNCTSYNNKTNYILVKSSYDGKKKKTINCLSLTNSSMKDSYSGTVENTLLCSSGYYFISYASNKSSTATTSDGKLKNYKLTDMVESTNKITPTRELHTTLRNPDNTINLGNYLKVKSSAEIYTMGSDGAQLGADLSKSSYYSASDTVKLIDAIGSPAKTSASYALIYKAAKSYNALSETEKSYVTNVSELISAINVYNG
ncbi:MAG: right-handed parallel beta-helix repeat-containing protein [Christensenellaceae bacterium]